jgi:hypothetical protein
MGFYTNTMFVLTNQVLGNSRIKQKEAACKYIFNEYHRLSIHPYHW